MLGEGLPRIRYMMNYEGSPFLTDVGHVGSFSALKFIIIFLDYLREHLPPLRRYMYCIHSNNVLQEKRYSTNKYANSFFPNVVKPWNSIGPELRDTDFISICKKYIMTVRQAKLCTVFIIQLESNTTFGSD